VAWLPFLLLILLICLSTPNESRPAASEKPLFLKEKLGPKATITNAEVERKGKTAKIAGKTHFFSGMCKTPSVHAVMRAACSQIGGWRGYGILPNHLQ
jgi:hypothetical protein